MTEMGSIKLAAMRNFINEVEVDICTITECNVDWKRHQTTYTQVSSVPVTGGRTATGA